MDAEAKGDDPDDSNSSEKSNRQERGKEGSFPISKKKRSRFGEKGMSTTRTIEYRRRERERIA